MSNDLRVSPRRQKFIYWLRAEADPSTGNKFALVHVKGEEGNTTFRQYASLLAEIQKACKDAMPDEVNLSWIELPDGKKCPLVSWMGFIPPGSYPGWTQFEGKRPEYKW